MNKEQSNQIKNDYITNSICAVITGGTLEDVKNS